MAWKAEHPGAAVVAYVNTSAEVKAESDVCCTSANAAEVVSAIPADREVLFLPDQFLGAHVRRVTGRENLHVWAGECHVHAGISPQALRDAAAANPEAELFVHPECGCSTSALWQAGTGDLPAERTRVLSTGGMLAAARSTRAPAVLVATEIGMLHQLRKANPAVRWEPVNPHASCHYMKMITAEALERCLRDGTTEVDVAPEVAARARHAVEAMIADRPGPGRARAPDDRPRARRALDDRLGERDRRDSGSLCTRRMYTTIHHQPESTSRQHGQVRQGLKLLLWLARSRRSRPCGPGGGGTRMSWSWGRGRPGSRPR